MVLSRTAMNRPRAETIAACHLYASRIGYGLLWVNENTMDGQVDDLLARVRQCPRRGQVGAREHEFIAWEGHQIDEGAAHDGGDQHPGIKLRADDALRLCPTNKGVDLLHPLRIFLLRLEFVEDFPAFGCLPRQDMDQFGVGR